jgi:hypothetical protein
MSKKSTAIKIMDIGRYAGEVSLFELSKQVKKGALSTKFIIVGRFKPRSGVNNTSIWFSDKNGNITFMEPIKEMRSESMLDALDQFGYRLA